jgi:hypothetical protein
MISCCFRALTQYIRNMMKTVYIETTIPSSYFDNRPEPEMVARQHWTRQWWDHMHERYEPYTSVGVLDELNRGNHPNKESKLSLLKDVPLLEITREVIEIADVYIKRFVMPSDPTGDALHLALTTFYKIDFLLTWNCEHLANVNKMPHIRRTNAMLGLWTPEIVTPLSLLEE